MSDLNPPDADRLRHIASALRALNNHPHAYHPDVRGQGGALLLQAVDAGAFSENKYVGMLAAIRAARTPELAIGSACFWVKQNITTLTATHKNPDYECRLLIAQLLEQAATVSSSNPILLLDDASVLQSQTPSLNTGNGQWIKNKDAADLESVETESLGKYRQEGIRTADELFGKDKDGRVWRKRSKNAHPWYLKSTLKSERLRKKNPG